MLFSPLLIPSFFDTISIILIYSNRIKTICIYIIFLSIRIHILLCRRGFLNEYSKNCSKTFEKWAKEMSTPQDAMCPVSYLEMFVLLFILSFCILLCKNATDEKR